MAKWCDTSRADAEAELSGNIQKEASHLAQKNQRRPLKESDVFIPILRSETLFIPK